MNTTSKTLKDLIIATKCRTGKSRGTTKRGAYWLCGKPTKIRGYGGDGIGNNSPSIDHWLELRHFRGGEVRALAHREASHQNGAWGGAGNSWTDVSGILECTTIEDVVVVLKGVQIGEDRDCSTSVYSDDYSRELTAALSALGLPESAPAPDEEPASTQK